MQAKSWLFDESKPVTSVNSRISVPGSVRVRFGGLDKPVNVGKLEQQVSKLELERIKIIRLAQRAEFLANKLEAENKIFKSIIRKQNGSHEDLNTKEIITIDTIIHG
ncbi:MAG: hypothetical protein ABJG33_04910 [Balneola sp.]